MDNEQKITKSALPAWVREFIDGTGYRGRKFAVVVKNRLTIPSDAGLWSGGTRDAFYVVTRDGSGAASVNNAAPGTGCGRDVTVEIPEDSVVARRSWFCGKDGGFTFYVPSPAASRALSGCGEECRLHG